MAARGTNAPLLRRQYPTKTRTRGSHMARSMRTSLWRIWSYIFFTDEAHIDPTSQTVGDILREQGKRYADENIQERGEKLGVRFHIAAWITWWDKAEKLEFYHDEEPHDVQPAMPAKPRRCGEISQASALLSRFTSREKCDQSCSVKKLASHLCAERRIYGTAVV
jgi:hypothetical protein